jgi:hypothetical protein
VTARGKVLEFLRRTMERLTDRLRSDLRHLALRSGRRSASGLALPDFMCIGAQKAGTTWLWENLGRHPEIFLPSDRYLHYFDRNFDRPIAEYARHFEGGRLKVKGEVIPGYGLIPRHRIRYLRALIPDLRLVFIMRNPVDRAWSHAVMNLMQFRGLGPDQITDDALRAHFDSDLSRSKGAYLRILDNWLTVFPAEALLVVFQDDIRSGPAALLNTVFRHVGVSPVDGFDGYDLYTLINRGSGLPMGDAHRAYLLDLYRADIVEIQARFGGASLSWLPPGK